MTNKEDLKKYALEKAIEVYSHDNEIDIIETSTSFYNFIEGKTVQARKADDDPAVLGVKLGTLNYTQQRMLKAAVAMHKNGMTINGAALARFMKGAFAQPTCSANLLALIKHGYMVRDGNKFFVKFDEMGKQPSAVIRRLPTNHAKGYKGQKLGDYMPDIRVEAKDGS